MNERLLQFIWQFQYFSTTALATTGNEFLRVEKTGLLNRHQGPDFSGVILTIGSTKWVGNVELHLRASDWHRHRHTVDKRYANIILHVVWEEDAMVTDACGNPFPTLVLQDRVSRLMLERYRQMMQQLSGLPCSHFLPAMDALHWMAWKERLAAERLERKAMEVLNRFRQNAHHWEATCWQMLAANFGMHINSPLFEQVAVSLPITLLARHRNHLYQLEALLLGQANLLAGKYKDRYALMLQKEYLYLKKKYHLIPVRQQPAFLRMRPAAFPTIRLAQLAMLLHRNDFLFVPMLEAATVEQLCGMLMVTAQDYWSDHYRLDEPALHRPKQLGEQMAGNIIINTIIPVLFAYGLYQNNADHRERAIQWLLQLSPEKNRISLAWEKQGISNQHALDSQALLELTNHYCHEKRCLDCAVGNRILRNDV